MKKQKLLNIAETSFKNEVSASSIKEAIEKDIDLIWAHANYESFDYEETFKTLHYYGIEALPNLKIQLNNLLHYPLIKPPKTFKEKIALIWLILRQ